MTETSGPVPTTIRKTGIRGEFGLTGIYHIQFTEILGHKPKMAKYILK